jgi:hypothetical protein
MPPRGSDTSGRTLLCVGLLVTVICLLPALVRATGRPISAPDSSSSFRLNRGFDKPESKRTLTPPSTESDRGAASEASTTVPPHCEECCTGVGAPVAHQHRAAVDPQRGPPAD